VSSSHPVPPITKDTRLCISLAGRPTSIGTRFHNFLYARLGLDFVYKSFSTDDLPAAVAGIRALGIRGCGVSMPYKSDCVPLLDELDTSAAAIGSVNTIVNTDGRLRGYNTDYLAIARLLAEHRVPADAPPAVLGSGGVARAVVAALRDGGYPPGLVVSRNPATGRELAGRFGFEWLPELADRRPALLVNATPVGMAGGSEADELPVSGEVVDAARVVFDVVATPPVTPLLARAAGRGIETITGSEMVALQALEQFALYTGVRPDAGLLAEATEYSRTT
jgi:shikimate dehydrogenase